MTYEFFKNLILAYLSRSTMRMSYVAASYALGDGVKKNEGRARNWYARAERAGDLYARYELAMMLLQGEGGPVELEKGRVLLEEAAKTGEPSAQKVLAYAYKDSLFGFPMDTEHAEHWKKLAQAQGMQV